MGNLVDLKPPAETVNRAVIICEGEKAADALRRLLPDSIVLAFGGIGAIERTDWEPLRGRHVLGWPDHDVPGLRAWTGVPATGRKSARRGLIDILQPIVAGLSLIDPTTCPGGKGGDAADMEAAGWTTAEVRRWIRANRLAVSEWRGRVGA